VGVNGHLESLNKLFFELSNKERMTILLELQKNKSKLSTISLKLKITVTEASRHLQRLSEYRLIQKDNKGLFELTPFGTLMISQLSGLRFLSNHRNYFLEYDISTIPLQFISRIGELEEGVYKAEVLKNLQEAERRFQEASEFIWILSEQVLTTSLSALSEKIKTSFDLRIVLPKDMFPSESKSQLKSTNPSVHKRVLPKVEIIIVITEKFAIFCLPNRNHRIDYTGFSGTDPNFINWCKDLFNYYWEKAKPFRNI